MCSGVAVALTTEDLTNVLLLKDACMQLEMETVNLYSVHVHTVHVLVYMYVDSWINVRVVQVE